MRNFSDVWARIAARIAASPALAQLQDDADPVLARRARAALVGLCLLLHLGFLILLRSSVPSFPQPAAERRLEITFIEHTTAAEDAPPAMPRRTARLAVRSLRAVRIDPPVPRASTRDSTLEAIAPDAPPSASDLLQQIPAFADGLNDDSSLGVRNPLRPIRPRLPGSEVAIVAGIKLRRQITPEDVVKGVGAFLFGGGYEACPDVLGTMHDATISNPARYTDAERRDLMESERRCRHR